MTDDATTSGPLPAVPYIKGAGTDDPYLEGMVCSHCGAVFLGERDTCSSCGGRDTLEKKRLGNTGNCTLTALYSAAFPVSTYLIFRPSLILMAGYC